MYLLRSILKKEDPSVAMILQKEGFSSQNIRQHSSPPNPLPDSVAPKLKQAATQTIHTQFDSILVATYHLGRQRGQFGRVDRGRVLLGQVRLRRALVGLFGLRRHAAFALLLCFAVCLIYLASYLSQCWQQQLSRVLS